MNLSRRLALAALVLPGLANAVEPRVFYSAAERPRVTADRIALLSDARLRETGSDQPPAPPGSSATSGKTGSERGKAGTDKPPAPAGPAEMRIEGVSLSQSGTAHAWIGGERYDDGSLFRGQRVRVRRNGVTLVDPQGPVRVLRVGESITAAAGGAAKASP
jgi:hypothetical protein